MRMIIKMRMIIIQKKDHYPFLRKEILKIKKWINLNKCISRPIYF